MTAEYIDILRNVRDNHSNGTYQKALDAAIEAMEEVERIRAERNDPQPLTNADRIRVMSDEELLAFIGDLSDYSNDCRRCPAEGSCDDRFKDMSCRKIAMMWLQQPAEGGDTDG